MWQFQRGIGPRFFLDRIQPPMASRIVVSAICMLLAGCPQSSSPEPADGPDGTQAVEPAEETNANLSQTPQDSAPEKKSSLFDDLDEILEEDSAPQELDFPIFFTDTHEEAGIDFEFDNGDSPEKLMPQSTSGGIGWIDYDRDGWPDLYCVQGGYPAAPTREGEPIDELFRNMQDGTFLSVTEAAMLEDIGYGHGVVAGDFNNDGFDDLYVSNVGEDAFYFNNGDGTFEEVAAASGMSNPLWATSAGWGDLNQDGNLDLYVCNYVDYDPFHPTSCVGEEGEPWICHPKDVDPIRNVCFINQGDGTFSEELTERGLEADGSKSLGVVIADFNRDGTQDIYVANDTTANHLFVNQGGGKFEEQGLALGCSMSGLGQFQASMGLAFGDFDRNGWQDLYAAHFTTDSNTLYRNLGESGFTDATRETGLHLPTLPFLAFGTVMADFNQDGWQDLFVANGHIDDWRATTGDAWYMPPQMFRFNGSQWIECTETAGPYFQGEYLGRAVASADYDRDGDLDLAVSQQAAPVALLRNDSESGHWLQIELIGTTSNRQGIGSEVILRQGDLKLTSQLPGGTSYCASHQPIILFGLGKNKNSCEIEIKWPSGIRQVVSDVAVDQLLTVIEADSDTQEE
ncbi:FG-GAP repeat protein [Thalassoglobus neptunius]|uniref:FG-GAP repeat protein n=2 Tax=Thalassoglobus neptunius TaxID=1938619 RepID=A0A5C5WM17_9PLAN|nr:FG-GAP repeat protein [Thalassoglobus neptunius]